MEHEDAYNVPGFFSVWDPSDDDLFSPEQTKQAVMTWLGTLDHRPTAFIVCDGCLACVELSIGRMGKPKGWIIEERAFCSVVCKMRTRQAFNSN